VDGTKAAAGERVALGVTVAKGVEVGMVGMLVGISADGPKGVNEAVAFGLGVMVGPITVGMDGTGPVQAVRSNKETERRKKEER